MQEANGRITDWAGEPPSLSSNGDVVASGNPEAANRLETYPADVDGPDRLFEIGDVVIDSADGEEFRSPAWQAPLNGADATGGDAAAGRSGIRGRPVPGRTGLPARPGRRRSSAARSRTSGEGLAVKNSQIADRHSWSAVPENDTVRNRPASGVGSIRRILLKSYPFGNDFDEDEHHFPNSQA